MKYTVNYCSSNNTYTVYRLYKDIPKDDGTNRFYGPFDSFTQAKNAALKMVRQDRDELNINIKELIDIRVNDVIGIV